MKLFSHLHEVQRLRMTGAIAPLPHTHSRVTRRQLCAFFLEREFSSYTFGKEFPALFIQNPKSLLLCKTLRAATGTSEPDESTLHSKHFCMMSLE